MTYWYKRYIKDVKIMDKNIIVLPFKHGFDRVFYKTPAKYAFLSEIPRRMTEMNYYEKMFRERLNNQSFYEENIDDVEQIQQTSNKIPGYYACIDDIQKKLYLFKNSSDFYYQTMNNTNII